MDSREREQRKRFYAIWHRKYDPATGVVSGKSRMFDPMPEVLAKFNDWNPDQREIYLLGQELQRYKDRSTGLIICIVFLVIFVCMIAPEASPFNKLFRLVAGEPRYE